MSVRIGGDGEAPSRAGAYPCEGERGSGQALWHWRRRRVTGEGEARPSGGKDGRQQSLRGSGPADQAAHRQAPRIHPLERAKRPGPGGTVSAPSRRWTPLRIPRRRNEGSTSLLKVAPNQRRPAPAFVVVDRGPFGLFEWSRSSLVGRSLAASVERSQRTPSLGRSWTGPHQRRLGVSRQGECRRRDAGLALSVRSVLFDDGVSGRPVQTEPSDGALGGRREPVRDLRLCGGRHPRTPGRGTTGQAPRCKPRWRAGCGLRPGPYRASRSINSKLSLGRRRRLSCLTPARWMPCGPGLCVDRIRYPVGSLASPSAVAREPAAPGKPASAREDAGRYRLGAFWLGTTSG